MVETQTLLMRNQRRLNVKLCYERAYRERPNPGVIPSLIDCSVLLALVFTGFQGMEYYQATSTILDRKITLNKKTKLELIEINRKLCSFVLTSLLIQSILPNLILKRTYSFPGKILVDLSSRKNGLA
ncbi:hypothetical protein Fot_19965 [Forsythia ovata]|uniref:Uncharacterized protein n=1 Tax=Forsythia ovata TaxID=205694 RepID=A0ABD1VMI7_9LAMI